MKIAILSDTHGRQQIVQETLRLLRERGIQTLLHCGDIDDAETIALFQGFTAHFVFGNCDRDRDELRQAIRENGLTLHEPYGFVELEGVKIGFIHGDDQSLLRDLERSGAFDFVFYGHTHQAAEHRSGPTRIVNPGALHRAQPKTFVLLDLAGRELESVTVG